MQQPIRVTTENLQEVLVACTDAFVQLWIETAVDLNYEVDAFPSFALLRVTHNGIQRVFQSATSPLNSHIGARIINGKHTTNTLLNAEGFPVSKSMVLSRSAYREGNWDIGELQYPLVSKPSKNTFAGAGIVTGIEDREELERVVQGQFKDYPSVLLEEFFPDGKDYRLLVLDGTVIAAMYRTPATVIGDGKRTVQELIRDRDTERKQFKWILLGDTVIDDDVLITMKKAGVTMETVLEDGQQFQLRNVCNLCLGGETEECLDWVHPENAKLAIEAAATVQLRLAGLDILCEDIRKPIRETRGIIVEVNASPAMTMHHYPIHGKPVNTSAIVMKAAFRD